LRPSRSNPQCAEVPHQDRVRQRSGVCDEVNVGTRGAGTGAGRRRDLTVETPNEVLADKAVALTAGAALKFRDVWDVRFLQNRLDAEADRETVRKKFNDYGTSDPDAKAEKRLSELSEKSTADAFLG
jgi:hypothetical protein